MNKKLSRKLDFDQMTGIDNTICPGLKSMHLTKNPSELSLFPQINFHDCAQKM